jgi:hypothetical protein
MNYVLGDAHVDVERARRTKHENHAKNVKGQRKSNYTPVFCLRIYLSVPPLVRHPDVILLTLTGNMKHPVSHFSPHDFMGARALVSEVVQELRVLLIHG